jgi:hypothetical protein
MVWLSVKDAAWLCQCLERRQAMQHSKIDANIKVLKQELLEEDAKADKLRSLHLYSCKITDWKFVCSKCYDKIYPCNIRAMEPHTGFVISLTLFPHMIQ